MNNSKLNIQPLTPQLLPKLAELFSDSPVTNKCWCMYWRIGPSYRKHTPSENKMAFSQIVAEKPSPGLLAFLDDVPVGWCQLTPKESLPILVKSHRLKHESTKKVWSISCFYIKKGYRKKGVSGELIKAAAMEAQKAGAEILEAYPLDPEKTPSSSSTGFVSTFERAGFKTVKVNTPPRPIMQLDLK